MAHIYDTQMFRRLVHGLYYKKVYKLVVLFITAKQALPLFNISNQTLIKNDSFYY